MIIVNMLIYLLGLVGQYRGLFDLETMVSAGHLGRHGFKVWQLVTYQFLHDSGSIWHLAFNMLFLWIFGCAVEDRLGRLSYLAFYLLGGATAGVAHMMISPNPVIGASGSISAVTGAFLAMFPRSRIKVLVIFFLIGAYNIPSLWFIGFFFALDVVKQVFGLLGSTEGHVAYAAHIAGYLYGFGTAFLLLATRVVKREEFDVFYLFKQARRRAAFRAAAGSGPAGPWESGSADTAKRLAKQQTKSAPISTDVPEVVAARAEITRLVDDHQLHEAAARYLDLLDEHPEAVLPERVQLDVANQLYSDGEHFHASLAYELLLHHYPRRDRAAEVRLLLGIIFARHLNQPDRARQFLEEAATALHEPEQKSLARRLLDELNQQ